MLAGWSKASGGPPAGLGALTCYAGAVAHRCGGISSLPPQTPPSPNCDLALPDWLPKMTLLVLFSNLPRTLWEERKEIKLIR